MKDIFERTLVITPHLDDETIGCGGTIAKIVGEGCNVKIVLATEPVGFRSAHLGCDVDPSERFESFFNAMKLLGVPRENLVLLRGFEESRTDEKPIVEMITFFDILISDYKPTAVLFPYSSHHQDHRYVNQAVTASLRPKVSSNFIRLKAMYEYPYITGWNDSFIPSSKIYIELTREIMSKKSRALDCYDSQLNRDPRDLLDKSSILSLASVRGHEIGVDYAEVLYPMSIVF